MPRIPLPPEALLDRLGLSAVARTPFRRLSGGQQQRLSLAAAIIGRPELVFLDEPTTGLDPQARMATWELIGELRTAGVGVVLTTHYMEEAEQLCDRVAIMDHGHILESGTVSDVISSHFKDRTIRFTTRLSLDDARLAGLRAVTRVVHEDDDTVLYTTDVPATIVDLERRTLVAFEALARWNRPGHGVVGPGTFIPLADELGYMVEIGRAVLREACRQARSWELAYPNHAHLTVNVNLAPSELQNPDLAREVAAILTETELAEMRAANARFAAAVDSGDVDAALQADDDLHAILVDVAGNRAVPRASASAMLTMVGIVLLLIPVLMRTWRDHRRGT